MLDIGWSEMAIILLVALIVIGPKDLPRVARTLGQWVRKGRALAREFQNQLEDMAREAELDKVKQEIDKTGRTDVKRSIEKTIDPEGDLGRAFDPTATGGKAKPKAGNGKTEPPPSPPGTGTEPSRATNGAEPVPAADQADKERAPAETN